MSHFVVKNPYTQQLITELPFANTSEINRTVESATQAFRKWRHSSSHERSELLLKAADRLMAEKEDFVQLICEEAGKPVQLARVEVDRGLGVLRWAAAEAQRDSGELLRLDTTASGRPGFGIHTRFPRGVVLGITPYNFPLNLVLHKVAPAIASGCSIIIKPSLFTPLTAMRLAKLFEATVPGLIQVILTSDADTAQLTSHPQIAKISFTGSARVGWMIRRQAPEKPTTLELGGNAWVVVMEDTPTELFPAIAKRMSGAAFGYAGQSCFSVQNAAVASSLWTEFERHLKAATEAAVFGDPSQSGVVSGPLIHSQAAEKVRLQLDSIPKNIEKVTSKSEISSPSYQPGCLLPPTLVVMPDLGIMPASSSPIVQEEIFAPVMTLHKLGDISHLIERINSSRYGLQTGAYTQNWAVIEKLYRELDVGGLVVNDVPTSRYDHQPYGGVKDSGQGREGIRYAMDEMTESKFLALSSQVVK